MEINNIADAAKRLVAEQRFFSRWELNGPSDVEEKSQQSFQLESMMGYPTTKWTITLTNAARVHLIYKIDAEDLVWTHLPFSIRLGCEIEVEIWARTGTPIKAIHEIGKGTTHSIQLLDWGAHSEELPSLFAGGNFMTTVIIKLYEIDTFLHLGFEKRLCADFVTLLESGTGSDVVIVANDGIEVAAHKFALIGRSPVFLAMLTGQNTEAKSGVIMMTDVTSVAIRSLLRYLYGGEVPKFVVNNANHPKFPCLSDLVYLADKYMLQDLTNFFDEHVGSFCDQGSVEDVVFLLGLTKLFSLKKAHADVRTFIKAQHATLLDHILDEVESGGSSIPFEENVKSDLD